MEKLLGTIQHFCVISGEKLNSSKSQIIFSSHHIVDDRLRLCSLIDFVEAKLPIMYLGAPLYKGRTFISYFQYLTTRVRTRIQGWAKNFFSLGGRVELIKYVLCAVGIHSMLTLPVPFTVIENMVSMMSAFLWDNGNDQRHHWISRDRICTDKDYGGLGFLWKLFHKVLPNDDTIRRINIPVPSKCSCCSTPSVETMDHLFFSSELARAVWGKLSSIFDRPIPRGRGTFIRWLRADQKNFVEQLATVPFGRFGKPAITPSM